MRGDADAGLMCDGAMYLQTLELWDFRNFPERHWTLSPEVNIIYGANAAGKTNLLEAIYVLSNLRSFRTHTLRDVIGWECSQASVKGSVLAGYPGEITSESAGSRATGKTLAVKIEAHARTALINAKPCRSSKEYLQVMPCVAFIPDDLELVKGVPESRRLFLDRGTFHYHPPYWSLLSEYHKIVQQKNAVLRAVKEGKKRSSANLPGEAPEDIWNEQLQQIGSKVILHRLRFVQQLQKKATHIYAQWLTSDETIQLRYKSTVPFASGHLPDLHDLHASEPEAIYQQIFAAYGQALHQKRDQERRLGVAVVGPHRDDLELGLWGRSLRAFGSQGQQRTAVLALKFAEAAVYFDQHDEFAVMLLDDVTSELDDVRVRKLFEYVQHGMQVFISTTSKPDLGLDRSLACTYISV